jgi:hypothetical protein
MSRFPLVFRGLLGTRRIKHLLAQEGLVVSRRRMWYVLAQAGLALENAPKFASPPALGHAQTVVPNQLNRVSAIPAHSLGAL